MLQHAKDTLDNYLFQLCDNFWNDVLAIAQKKKTQQESTLYYYLFRSVWFDWKKATSLLK